MGGFREYLESSMNEDKSTDIQKYLRKTYPKIEYEYVMFRKNMGEKGIDGVYDVTGINMKNTKPTKSRFIATTWKKTFDELASL